MKRLRPLTLTVTISPSTHAEWVLALRYAPVGTVLSDCDGDIWTKRYGYCDDGLNWKRTNGGWAAPEEVARHAPLHEIDDREAPR